VLRQQVLPVLGRELGRWASEQGRRDLGDDRAREELEAASLTWIFRALFLLYAGSAGHLPMTNPTYASKSLTRIAQRAWEEQDAADEHACSLWDDVASLVRQMRTGQRAWDLPACNGDLFAADGVAGAETLEGASISDAVLGPVLVALARDEKDPGVGLDFSRLEIGHLGYVYEGLSRSTCRGPTVTTSTTRAPTALVREQLDALRTGAGATFGAGIEDTALLKRLVLKRCVYGVDVSALGTEIAKVSLWLATFVPGLSLAYLDHNIQRGNSLIGITRPDGVADGTLFGPLIAEQIAAAARHRRPPACARSTTRRPSGSARARRPTTRCTSASPTPSGSSTCGRQNRSAWREPVTRRPITAWRSLRECPRSWPPRRNR